jgi:hypothetical protein
VSWLPKVLAVWFVLSLLAGALWAMAFGSFDLTDEDEGA